MCSQSANDSVLDSWKLQQGQYYVRSQQLLPRPCFFHRIESIFENSLQYSEFFRFLLKFVKRNFCCLYYALNASHECYVQLLYCSDPSWGGRNYILKRVFFCSVNFGPSIYSSLRLASLESLSSVEHRIKKVFLIFFFDKEISRFKLSRK